MIRNQRWHKIVTTLEETLIKNIEDDWNMSYGGFKPSETQFGRTVILPALFANEQGRCLNDSFLREYHKTGLRTIFQGRDQGTLPNGFRVGLVGIAVTIVDEEPLILSDFKLEIPFHNVVEQEEIKEPCIAPARTLKDVAKDFVEGKTDEEEFAEEVESYEKEPRVVARLILSKGYEIKENTKFRLLGTIKDIGVQRVIPLGFCFYKGSK